MNVWVHRATKSDGVAREQWEPSKVCDLVKIEAVLRTAHLNAVGVCKLWYELSAVAFPIALDAGNFVKKCSSFHD